jgi:hypothetical protein
VATLTFLSVFAATSSTERQSQSHTRGFTKLVFLRF